ncbi:LytTR family DNA-binding domain-containing protein [Alkaliphilus sp. MSJ-5]|uniref:LytTR family DNA-binding domain-containing protein n=1 Tax=Alkaliphilus flagellatus TaxID=2841507 RepID=A0ABS6G194_9FIRM|nr:LytTR family DNA-binding domain-containing protein [Alkaliphilus flagellatus]MBU5676257.1 LytTR family DNA-binding domain-containing protein [Alkaliphilus flagellatus]
MILNIGICDDDSVHVDLIKSYIHCIDMPYKVNYILAYSGEELLEKIKGYVIDVVFLDIEMKDLDGIQTGRKIREKDKDAVIVYLTGYRKYALEAFEIESFNYLIKPIIKEKFIRVMEKILLRLEERQALQEKKKTFPIQTKDKLIQLQYDDIYYFEKHFRKIKIYTLNETIEFYGSMKDLLEKIDFKYFVRCHQSYIVNKRKIREIRENTIVLKEKDEWNIPISRTYKKETIDSFCEILFRY